MSPELTQHPLARADGSASFSSHLFAVLAAVNGPVEVLRRDELPEEAAVEVNVRPCSGVGGPRERWLESCIASLLRSVVIVHLHPRTLVQVTLQVTKEPGLKMKKHVADVAVIPSLANAAFLALVDAGLPLRKTVVSALGVVDRASALVVEPTEKEIAGCKSVHAMAYTAQGEMLLDQSIGEFGIEQWREVADRLRETALSAMGPASEDEGMGNSSAEATSWLRQALEENVQQAGTWRRNG